MVNKEMLNVEASVMRRTGCEGNIRTVTYAEKLYTRFEAFGMGVAGKSPIGAKSVRHSCNSETIVTE
jgi:hypothetical protein